MSERDVYSPLGPNELKLLAFLCHASENRIRIKALRYPATVYNVRLRRAGLVEPDSFAPTPWGIKWNAAPPESPVEAGTGVSPPIPVPAVPPKKKRPPRRKIQIPASTENAYPKARTVDLKVNATPVREEPVLTPAEVVKRAAKLAKPNRRDPTQRPEGYRTERDNAGMFEIGQRKPVSEKGDSVTRGLREEAARRLAAGQDPDRQKSVILKIQMREQRDAAARLERASDPVESAKTILRRHYSPVVSAEFSDPPGKKGTFRVGREILTREELLALAEKKREATGR